MTPLPEQPTVSVIVPLYNKERTVSRAIRSVLKQEYSNFQLIIVDDGSTDDGPVVVENISDNRIHLIRQKNMGPGAARNAGAAVSSGDLLAFLDADDEWHSTYLSTAVFLLLQHPRAAAYVCGYDAGAFRDARPNKVQKLRKSGVYSPPIEDDGPRLKLHVDAMHSSCVVVYRDTFFRYEGYFTRDNCRYGEDSFLMLLILLSEAVCWDPQELAIFHVEDSALGFAVKIRTTARPLSLYPYEVITRLPKTSQPAAARAIRTFAEMDYHALKSAGAHQRASEVYRKNGLSPLRKRVSALLGKLKRIVFVW